MNELIKMYCYYEDMMMQNMEDERYIIFKKLRDYIGSLIEGEYENG